MLYITRFTATILVLVSPSFPVPTGSVEPYIIIKCPWSSQRNFQLWDYRIILTTWILMRMLQCLTQVSGLLPSTVCDSIAIDRALFFFGRTNKMRRTILYRPGIIPLENPNELIFISIYAAIESVISWPTMADRHRPIVESGPHYITRPP